MIKLVIRLNLERFCKHFSEARLPFNTYLGEATANIRRAAWSFLQIRATNPKFQLDPSVRISGINGVSVSGIKFGPDAISFIKLLDETQNSPGFEKPLNNISREATEFLKKWLSRSLDQSDLNSQQSIQIEDIIQMTP